MIRSTKILWGEGLFLRPQHFQRQDAYHEWRQAESVRAVQPYGWGVRDLRIDVNALQTGVLRLTALQLVFPDGELFSAPEEDDLPPPIALSNMPAGTSEAVFHLALAPMRTPGTNYAVDGDLARGNARFAQRNENAADWFTEAVEVQLATLRRQVRLLADDEPRDQLISLALLRVQRQATGGFVLDPRFVPASLSIAASPTLQTMLRGLLDVLQAKVDALYGLHREPSRHVIEFRSGDIASFWLLHTCSAAFASLSHLFRHQLLHPERLFERLLELAGALMTFSRSHGLADLPTYQHEAPEHGFRQLDEMVRQLLETVISTRYFAIALEEVRPSYHQGRLDSEKIDTTTRFYIGLQASLPATELADTIPQRLKVGAPDDVEKAVLSALSAVGIVHAPQVPAAIPVRPGSLYFAVEARGPLYDRMLQSRTISLYAPSGLPDLRLELFALNDQ